MRALKYQKLYDLLTKELYIIDQIHKFIESDESVFTNDNINYNINNLLEKKIKIDNEINKIKL